MNKLRPRNAAHCFVWRRMVSLTSWSARSRPAIALTGVVVGGPESETTYLLRASGDVVGTLRKPSTQERECSRWPVSPPAEVQPSPLGASRAASIALAASRF